MRIVRSTYHKHICSFALLSLAISSVCYFNNLEWGGYGVVLGFVSTGALGGYHTFDVQRSLNMGVVLFIVTYFHSALSPTVELGSQWPAPGVEPLNAFEIPLLNTILLLTSASSLTYAHHALINGSRKSCLIGFVITLALAVTFTGFQALDTGFHGIHVIIGTIFLTVALYRIISYQLTDHHHLGFEAAALY
ncbi:cytochrome c oxidase subunit III domain-containing protein [Phakopsora pachyrhizi]|uniref:Cytochrome c oxidase subunit 3 n=1 Tax=Phakopsora pachyrhizi TaxID=170000 RepID=A0AAV0BFN5_PHAPC|nr:cytochrome c oxidase subunit III domain-containing protein [Phakopsora pachyrhizi]